MRAYVEPILKLLIDIIITENLEMFAKGDERINNSIISNIKNARNIVLTDLSNKKDSKLLVR